MIIHIMPTYLCNNNCEYCYLGELKHSKTIIPLQKVINHLQNISKIYRIEYINIYGGEITLLPYSYITALIDISYNYCHQISITSNMKSDNTWKTIKKLQVAYPGIMFTTSINEERTGNDALINKLLIERQQSIGITQVVTPTLLLESPKAILTKASMIGKSVEFLRYSPGGGTANWALGINDFEDFMIKILDELHSNEYDIYVKNKEDIEDCLRKTYNPYSNSNLFLEPDGSLSVVSYTDNGNEHFKKVNNFEEVERLTKAEKNMTHIKCDNCPYLDHCYAEHIKFTERGGCCGCRRLLNYYEKNLYKNN